MIKRISWSQEEVFLLEDLAGYYPVHVITEKINEYNRKNDRNIVRNMASVRSKMYKLGLSYTPTENNMTATMWAKMLEIKVMRVIMWKNLGLKRQKVSCNQTVISISDMKSFAQSKPHLFADIKQEILEYYFGKELAEIITNNRKQRELLPVFYNRKIIDTFTGKIYSSIGEASRDVFLCRSVISRNTLKPDGRFKRLN